MSNLSPRVTPDATASPSSEGCVLRWFGLDIHKEYLTAVAVNAKMEVVFTANKITWSQFEAWARKQFSKTDAIVIEMTTNTWEVYDFLAPLCHSVIVVHPPTISGMMPHNAKTDKHDATQLAQLHAAGLLAKKAVWIPMNFAYEVGVSRLSGQSAVQFVRNQMDALGIGIDLKQVSRNKKGKRLFLPSSRLDPNAVIEPPEPTYQFGCATLPNTPDPRTRADCIKVGLSDPNGPKKKRKLKVQTA